jgi:eukaryotic-like serine/threonine-protein kinase
VALGPGLLIPRSTITIAEGAFRAGAAGSYGTVVPAQRDGSKLAVKLYNYEQLGHKDMSKALREAVIVNRLCHTNVVRCHGIVDDPDTASSKSIHGSLVMEWVAGGQLYKWLQGQGEDEEAELPLSVRLGVALQVAAGMRHLHACKVMHGDLKPQNVLLRQRPLAPTDCPEVSHSHTAGRTC